jgi:uncharacterized protein (TIRG00374 family)
MHNHSKHRLIPILKFVLISALLYFLFRKGFISVQATHQALQEWQIMVPAIACLFLTTCLGVQRWRWLLEAQGIQIPLGRVFQLALIGNFFNVALPGAVSGDFVKVFYIGKEVHGHRSKAFGSVLFDRVAGLTALILVSAGALLMNYQVYVNTPLLKAIEFFVESAATCFLIFYTYLFFVREHRDPLLKLLVQLSTRLPRTGFLVKIYTSLKHYHNHRVTVVKVIVLSVIIHLIVGWSCLQFTMHSEILMSLWFRST